jgi:aldehyde dehydrogenase (NAD+)
MPDSIEPLLKRLGVKKSAVQGGKLSVYSPIDGKKIAALTPHTTAQANRIIETSVQAFDAWKAVPAPVRGELVRLYGEELRAAKADLGRLVTIEAGKILSEGLGEVQEMIDICDFAVGLSRQLYGLTIASERPGHHMREMWHPLGPVGVISAFNFPVAVWCWNSALAWVCGDPVIWKPSEKTPVTALACAALFERALEKFKAAGHDAPEGLCGILIGDRKIGEVLSSHPKVPLVSATGSVRMGKAVAETVSKRLGRSLLELGGNNAVIVAPSADLKMAVQAILFGAVGTAGQRCTSIRRVIVHDSLVQKLCDTLVKSYGQLRIGDPLKKDTLVCPLIDKASYTAMQVALKRAVNEGGDILVGGKRVAVKGCEGGYYVQPAIVRMLAQTDVVHHETFAPILYVMTYRTFGEAIALQNDVPQGLSSCIFTTDMREAEKFVSATGSDCGIANVNTSSSGAEIGGAFGGEKETGGGREAGSDSWKAYMRRQTQTINYSTSLPLAQGVTFDL